MNKIHLITRILFVAAFLMLGLAFLPFTYPRNRSAKNIFCLADVSRSISSDNLNREEEIINRFRRQSQTTDTIFKIISFAETPSRPKRTFSPVRPKNADFTAPETALLAAAKLIPSDTAAEILLLSDGAENKGDLCHTARRLRIPISVVPLSSSSESEISINQLSIPPSVCQQEPFRVDVTLYSNIHTDARLTLFENGKPIDSTNLNLNPGKTSHSFLCRSETIGKSLLTVVAESKNDSNEENNILSAITEIRLPLRILFLTLDPSELTPFVERLKRYGRTVSIIHPDDFPKDPDSLENVDIVFLSDIPATALSKPQFRTLDDFVRNRGGALFLSGGIRSFASGEYPGSDLESILPVRSDYTPDRNEGETAICFLIDRSGSMKGEKLRFAKSAVSEAMTLLSGKDRVGIIAFDQKPEVVVPLQRALITPTIRDAVDTVTSGGGTNIIPAVQEAKKLLEDVRLERKHIIHLSDGISSSFNPKELIDDLRGEKITLSIVLTEESPQEYALRLLAEGTGGIFYRSNDPALIPRLFISETERIRRSSIEETECVPNPVGENENFLTLFPILPTLKGYVRTEAKSDSEILLTMPDNRPLLAHWRLGLGSVTVWTSDITPRWSADWLSDEKTPVFWSFLFRQAVKPLTSSAAPVIGHSQETELPLNGTDFLKRIADITGGEFNPNPEEFFKNRPKFSVRISTRRYFLFGAFFLFLTGSLAARFFRNCRTTTVSQLSDS